jgi:large subunit ribosomal protein L4
MATTTKKTVKKATVAKATTKSAVKKEAPVKVVKVTKPPVTKATAKVVKSEQPVVLTPVKKAAKKENQLTVDILGTDGKVVGSHNLATAVFGVKINKQLIAQAVRVYLANQRQGNASTKTRGEVTGSTRKIYRQKGTGRARHGGIRAPIFVGGGVAWGPRPHDFNLSLPQKMKQLALASALSSKAHDQEVKIVEGLEKLEGKTKKMVGALANLKLKTENIKKNPKILLIINDGATSTIRAARNIDRVTITSASRVNVYDVLTTKHVVFTKEAVENLEERFKV